MVINYRQALAAENVDPACALFQEWISEAGRTDSVASLLQLFPLSSTFRCTRACLIPDTNRVFLEFSSGTSTNSKNKWSVLSGRPIDSISLTSYRNLTLLVWTCTVYLTWPTFQPIISPQSGKQLRFNQSHVTKIRKQHVGLSLVLYCYYLCGKPLYINQLENSIGKWSEYTYLENSVKTCCQSA